MPVTCVLKSWRHLSGSVGRELRNNPVKSDFSWNKMNWIGQLFQLISWTLSQTSFKQSKFKQQLRFSGQQPCLGVRGLSAQPQLQRLIVRNQFCGVGNDQAILRITSSHKEQWRLGEITGLYKLFFKWCSGIIYIHHVYSWDLALMYLVQDSPVFLHHVT